jgi:large-conductance mechanosensitive channel
MTVHPAIIAFPHTIRKCSRRSLERIDCLSIPVFPNNPCHGHALSFSEAVAVVAGFAVMAFAIAALMLVLFVRGFNRIRRLQPAQTPVSPPKNEVFLTEIRDLIAKRA